MATTSNLVGMARSLSPTVARWTSPWGFVIGGACFTGTSGRQLSFGWYGPAAAAVAEPPHSHCN